MLNQSIYSAFRQMMTVFVTVLLVSLVGGVQAKAGNPLPPPPPSMAGTTKPAPSAEVQAALKDKLAEIQSSVNNNDKIAAQSALKDVMASGWIDYIYVEFYIDPYNSYSDGCQYIYLYSYWGGYMYLPCMFLAPVLSMAQADYTYVYINYYGWGG